jgi:hypothetical protein
MSNYDEMINQAKKLGDALHEGGKMGSSDAIRHEYQELITELETLGMCLDNQMGKECIKRAWERMTILDQMIHEAHPYPWGGSLNQKLQDFQDATIARRCREIFDLEGIE